MPRSRPASAGASRCTGASTPTPTRTRCTVRAENRIEGPRRRFAGIIVDLSYDHFLALRWAHHAPLPLDELTAQVYAALARHRESLPPRLARIAPHMAGQDWLGSYRRLEAVGGRARRHRDPLAPGRAACGGRRRRAALLRGTGRRLRRLLSRACGTCEGVPGVHASGGLKHGRHLVHSARRTRDRTLQPASRTVR